MENDFDINLSSQDLARVHDVERQLPSTPTEYKGFVRLVIELVNEGHASPLGVLRTLKTMHNLYEDIKDFIMSACIADYQRNREKGNVVHFGMYEITEENVGVRYDYSNDALWVSIKGDIESLKETYGIKDLEAELKAREETLRSVGKGGNALEYDTNRYTGEVFIRQKPVMASGKNALKFHRKKKD